MTYTELFRSISAILPNATVGEDNEGQLVIYTDMMQASPSDDDPLVALPALDTYANDDEPTIVIKRGT